MRDPHVSKLKSTKTGWEYAPWGLCSPPGWVPGAPIHANRYQAGGSTSVGPGLEASVFDDGFSEFTHVLRLSSASRLGSAEVRIGRSFREVLLAFRAMAVNKSTASGKRRQGSEGRGCLVVLGRRMGWGAQVRSLDTIVSFRPTRRSTLRRSPDSLFLPSTSEGACFSPSRWL